MSWTTFLILVAILALFVLFKRAGQISAKDARAKIESGALLIDVRTPGEFNSGHLPNAINLPLDGIESTLPRRITGKNQPLLLHCQSGMRSSVARKKLLAMGYANAFNLGSYGRAAQIVSGK